MTRREMIKDSIRECGQSIADMLNEGIPQNNPGVQEAIKLLHALADQFEATYSK